MVKRGKRVLATIGAAVMTLTVGGCSIGVKNPADHIAYENSKGKTLTV
ncbi:hypothetical protein [Bifidobacterium bombi]|nr:hypothetical protein [Bifidobacterium bombi]